MNKIISKSCANGLKIIYQKDNRDELIALNIFLPLGIQNERDCKGIGAFITNMLFKGTKVFDINSFAYELEINGVKINSSRRDDYIHFSILMHKDSFTKGMELFFEMFFNPRFENNEIEKLKQEYIHKLKSRHDNISTICFDDFLNIVYGGSHPYSWLTIGTEKSISSINRERLLDFHKDFMLSVPPIITILGEVDEIVLEEVLINRFKDLEYRKNNEYSLDEIKLPENEAKIKRIKKSFNQAYIMSGFIIPNFQSPYFLLVKIINSFLGEGMTSLFFDRIREKMGIVYEIGSFYSINKSQNYWAIHLGLDKNNVQKALDTIDKE
ncbi:M16 family metallopeptidase, partial [bacterium]